MEHLRYEVSGKFHAILVQSEHGVEPILIADVNLTPSRIFLVRYFLGEGGSGENSRPIFRNELTGYDYELRITYPTQKDHLEALQSMMEAFMYAPQQAVLSKALVKNQSTGSEMPIKMMISKELVKRLIEVYEYAW